MEDNAVNTVEETTSQKPVEETTAPSAAELQERLAKLEETNKQLYARVKKAEGAPNDEQEQPQPTKVESNKDDTIGLIQFFAQGNSQEDYEQLQVIMKGQGLSMQEASQTPLYKSYKAQKEAADKAEKAQLGGSNGVAPQHGSKFKPGMTREEHKAAWKNS